MIKIKNRIKPSLVTPVDMNVGAVGVIAKWSAVDMNVGAVGVIAKWSVPSYIGMIVMKVDGDRLIMLDPMQQAQLGGWTGIRNFTADLLIEILPPGTVIEITL